MSPSLPSWARGPCPYRYRWLLDNPIRRLLQPMNSTLDAIDLPKGNRALELGSGSGHFSVEAARRMGVGELVCLDIQPKMAGLLRRRLEGEGVGNARIIVGDALNLPLAADSLDAAFLVTVLGELPDRSRALAELQRVLRDSAVLSITESLPDPHYQRERTVRGECEASGFRWKRTVRRPLGFTMNFATVKAKESAGNAPVRSR
jgi:ubiquinone/menaquinone biosynthesis C-methylase UbiE